MYDLLIRNGRVVDGTGNPWFRADVAVKDGTVAAIGRIEGKAERVIDADGLFVAPGFIDVHCHADFTVLDPRNPRDFKLRQGITTECAGQCGESAAPVNPDTLDLLKSYVAFEAPVDGVLSWRWCTFDEYLRELEAIDIPTNFVSMVGHGTVRIDAMGFDNRPPTETELARMKSTVGEAMEAGAFGFSVGLAYAPGDYARNDEVIELAKVSAAHGGIFGTHMRDYGDGIFESLEESFEVGRKAKLPVVISHIGVTGNENIGKIGEVLDSIEGAREEGLEVTTDVYPLAAGTTLRVLLPHWVSEGSLEELFRRLRDPGERSRMKQAMIEETARIAADITIFDLDTVSASLDGNKCYPKGIEHVVLNGQVVVDAGRYHGAMAGRVVRRNGAGAGAGSQTRTA